MKRDLTLYPGSLMGRIFGANRLQELTSELETLWRDWDFDMKTFTDLQPKSNFPKVNVWEEEDAYKVEIALAGFNKDDIALELKDNSLLIKADTKEESSNNNTKCLLKEISSRSFRRVLAFPKKVLTNSVECSYKNGIVSCTLKKEIDTLPEEDVVKINIG